MKKYITVENNIYEATLVLSTDKTNDEFVPANRKTGTGGDKNHFFVSSNLYADFEKFFPLILKDKRTKKSNVNNQTIKNYFSVSNILNDLDLVNREIVSNYKKETIIDIQNFSETIFKIAKEQNLKTNFYIESELGSAGNGIAFKDWKNSFSNTIKLLLLHTTKTKVYLFKKQDEICSYFEFNQDYVKSINKHILSTKKDSKFIIYFGAPGTGKSYKLNNEIENIDVLFFERVTFHPEFDHSSFVGGYKPKSEKDDSGNDVIKYQFVPQAFTNIYVRAWNDIESHYYLIIEEINRGNCAEIFGDIFQLLDRNSNYTISPSNELKEYLNLVLINEDGIKSGLILPPNLSILATMNTSDQSLFPMDSAFKRRWDWEYVPICYDDKNEEGNVNESHSYKVNLDENTSFEWIKFIETVNTKIKNNSNLGMDKCIGNYFIKSDSKEITLKEFVNKVVFYLWNDVFKDEDSSESIFEKGISYEDFFPINKKGKLEVEKILKALEVTIS